MIPSYQQVASLWKRHNLPPYKQLHCRLVAKTAVWFACQLEKHHPDTAVRIRLLEAAALVHDIDKMAHKLPHERHPDAAVRILREEGFGEVSDIVRTHPLHAILDQSIAPKSIEEKLLYLSDKMVKHSIITVDERFALWREEGLPPEAVRTLDAAYPKVKALENEICSMIGVTPKDIAALANAEETSTMGLDKKGGQT